MKMPSSLGHAALRPLLGLTIASLLAGCTTPVMVGTVLFGGTAWVMSDRRTAGVMLEDEGIEMRARNRTIDVIGNQGHVVVNSYNRQVLLTGEVFNESDRRAVEQAVRKVDNVASISNELVITWPSSMSERTNDLGLQAKVKATLLNDGAVPSTAFKVVVERGVVYLMARVTAAEADRATELTRNIAGVKRVVRLIEIVPGDPAGKEAAVSAR
jgi:osmotically-inducible protein OsmY